MGGRGPNTQHRDWTVTNTSSLLLLQISPTLTLNCPIRHPLRPPHDLQQLPGRIHHRKPSSVPTSPSFPRQTPPVFSAWLEALVLLHPGASSPWRWDCHLISSLVHCPCCPLGTACPCPSSACLRDLPKSCPNFVPGRGDDQTGTLRVTRPWMMLGALVSEHRSGRGTSGFPGVSAVRIPLAELRQLSLCLGCPGSGAATAASWTSSPSLQTCWKPWRGMAATAPTPALVPEVPARTGMSARGSGEGLGGTGSCSGTGLGSQGW